MHDPSFGSVAGHSALFVPAAASVVPVPVPEPEGALSWMVLPEHALTARPATPSESAAIKRRVTDLWCECMRAPSKLHASLDREKTASSYA